jgi:hypothetical protein
VLSRAKRAYRRRVNALTWGRLVAWVNAGDADRRLAALALGAKPGPGKLGLPCGRGNAIVSLHATADEQK